MAPKATNIILFDDSAWKNLLPLTFTRPVCEIRVGITTIKEKWEMMLPSDYSYFTQDYLKDKYDLELREDNLLINGSVIPNQLLCEEIASLENNQALIHKDILIAARINNYKIMGFNPSVSDGFETKESEAVIKKIEYPWHIFSQNGAIMLQDYENIIQNRTSAPIGKTNNLLGKDKIFVEPGAKMEYVTLNAEKGPIYIGKDTEIMEGTVIRGPFAMCNHAVVKLNAKIYGPTTLGPHVKVGGEINNSVFQGYANKAHDGFLGNSVIGEWCNLGADTNNSNLKNNYKDVKVWNYGEKKFINTGLQFCGLIMGDHSKCGINTMFNTGTVVGVNANIFGDGFPRNFIPSFAWGGANKYTLYTLDKAFEVAEKVMSRRNIELDETEKAILEYVFNATAEYRNFG